MRMVRARCARTRGNDLIRRRSSSTFAVIAIAGLMFVGASCSSNGDNGAQADRGSRSAQSNDRGSAALPEGWPDGVEMPEGIEIGLSKAKTRNGESVLMVMGTVPDGDVDSVYDWIAANLVDAGFTMETPGDGAIPGYNVRALTGGTNDQTMTVKVTPLDDDVLVNYTVEPRH